MNENFWWRTALRPLTIFMLLCSLGSCYLPAFGLEEVYGYKVMRVLFTLTMYSALLSAVALMIYMYVFLPKRQTTFSESILWIWFVRPAPAVGMLCCASGFLAIWLDVKEVYDYNIAGTLFLVALMVQMAGFIGLLIIHHMTQWAQRSGTSS